jgi:4-amino-4-deoxy-L-arabinose transferase-like glycosyltransferase
METESAGPAERLQSPLVAAALAGWAALVLLLYYRARWPQLPSGAFELTAPHELWRAAGRALQQLVLLAWLLLTFFLLGRRLRRFARLSVPDRLTRLCVSLALGAVVSIAILMVLGVTGLYSTPILLVGFTLGSMVLLLVNRELYQESAPKRWFRRPAITGLEGVLMAVVAAYGLLVIFHALTPETSYDALVYHLALPELWLVNHRLSFPTRLCFSGLPLNGELLFGLTLALSGDTLCKLLHAAFGFGCLAMIYRISRRWSTRAGAWLAVLIALSSPMIILEFTRSAVDLIAAFFSLAAGLAVLVAGERRTQQRRRWRFTAGVFAAVALGTKYPAWVLGPALLAAIIAQNRMAHVAWWTDVAATAGVCAAGVLPWLVKNAVVFGNPVYPFLHVWVAPPPGGLVNWGMLQAEGGRNWHDLREWGDILFHPVTATFGGRAGGNYLGPAYLLFLPAALLGVWDWRTRLWSWLFGIQWTILVILSFMPRFWITALFFLPPLIAAGMTRLPRHARLAGTAIILLISGLNLYWSHRFQMLSGAWAVTLGQVAPSVYLRTPRGDYPAPYDPAARWMNEHLPQDSRVLILGDARSFGIQRDRIMASMFDENPLFVWANLSQNGEALYGRVLRAGLTHVLFNAAEAARLLPVWRDQLKPQGRQALDDFWRLHLRTVYDDQQIDPTALRSVTVYEITHEAGGTGLTESALLEIWRAGRAR